MHLLTKRGMKHVATMMQVFGMLKAACKAVLAIYTSLEHDEEVLKQCSADACMQAAVSWRIAYKR